MKLYGHSHCTLQVHVSCCSRSSRSGSIHVHVLGSPACLHGNLLVVLVLEQPLAILSPETLNPVNMDESPNSWGPAKVHWGCKDDNEMAMVSLCQCNKGTASSQGDSEMISQQSSPVYRARMVQQTVLVLQLSRPHHCPHIWVTAAGPALIQAAQKTSSRQEATR